jgi:protease IV
MRPIFSPREYIMNTTKNKSGFGYVSLLAVVAAALFIFNQPAWSDTPAGQDETTAEAAQTTDQPKTQAAQADPSDEAQPADEAEVTTEATEVSEEATEEATEEDEADPAPVVGWLELSDSLRDGPIPFAWVSSEEAGPSLGDVLGQLEYVAEHDEYLGVVIFMDHPSLRLSQVLSIAEKIAEVRAAGKVVMTYAEAYDTMDYLLACAADMILLQHKGQVQISGVSVEEMYLAGLLEKIGAKADFIQVGKYKGASEALMRTGPSEAWSQNFDALLDDLYSQIVSQIAKGRAMTQTEVEGLMRDGWVMQDSDYLKRRVVDRLTDRDLVDITEVEFGDDFTWDTSMGFGEASVNINNPMMLFGLLFKEQDTRTYRPTIAVVHATGAIHSGKSSQGQGLFDAPSIGSRSLVGVLNDARDDENIKGVILRISSPGGSALASEIIWQAVRDLGEQKPVFISVGSMAASGGYYIASAGDEVYLSPSSIVGSIGVVGGKIVMGGLYEWAGIKVHRRSRGPMGDIFNSVEPFTQDQRAAVLQSMEQVYDQFIQRVTIGRGSRLPDVGAVAEGRLFTGRQAVENGMADKLGGVAMAMTDMTRELGMEDGSYDVVHLPRAMSLQSFLNNMFGGTQAPKASASATSSPWILTAKRVLGNQAWSTISATMQGLLLLQDEPVLTLMPNAIIVR